MNTLLLNPTKDSTAIQKAAELLRNGELVAFPTETVYGLGARIFDVNAINKIYAAKERPADNPLIAHISSLQEVDRIAKNLPDMFYPLAKSFFPGPLTIVVPRNDMVPSVVSAGSSTIAIRMPNNELALALIRAVGEPLVAPSANISGKPSPTTAQDVLEDMQGKIAAVIDGGPSHIGIESTVLDLTTSPPRILRPGAITKQKLEQFLKTPVTEASISNSNEDELKAPGMKYRHYAPNAHIVLTSSWEEVMDMVKNTQKKYLLLSNEPLPPSMSHISCEPLSTTTLYATFRQADRMQYDGIVLFIDEKIRQDTGLMNRIEKAAAKEQQ